MFNSEQKTQNRNKILIFDNVENLPDGRSLTGLNLPLSCPIDIDFDFAISLYFIDNV